MKNRSIVNQFFKVGLSGFVLFHLTCIFVWPNPDSVIYRQLTWLVNYGNFLGLNTTWRFFSPNPAIRLTEYEVYTRNEDGELSGESFRYPKKIFEEPSREIHNRKFYHSMWMLQNPDFQREILGPKLCEWHPKAEVIAIYARGLFMSSIESSRFLGEQPERENMWSVQRHLVTDVNCQEGSQ